MLIDNERLRDIVPVIAARRKFRPATVEKDYHITIMLNNVGRLLSDRMVLKGGTLLNKIYLNHHRLSEDLDFTYLSRRTLGSRSLRSKAMTPVRRKMPGFLKELGLESENPAGQGFNNSTQYVFHVQYPSFITGKDEMVKLEISLRQPPRDKPVLSTIRHFFQDPFTNQDLIPAGKVLALSFREAVAEKLKASIVRRDVAIRDYYDLWCIAESGFDFCQTGFVSLFKRKLSDERFRGDYQVNFGLSADMTASLYRQIESDLMPVVTADVGFDLDKVFKTFNAIFSDRRFGNEG